MNFVDNEMAIEFVNIHFPIGMFFLARSVVWFMFQNKNFLCFSFIGKVELQKKILLKIIPVENENSA